MSDDKKTEQPKPDVGEVVHYFDPKVGQRIGWTEGFGGRGEGPYAALVLNDRGVGLELLALLPGVGGHLVKAVPQKDDRQPAQEGSPYWDYRNAAQKARAAKS